MPCSDSSSGLNMKVDLEDKLISFEFAKITCSSEISGGTGLATFCKGKPLSEILELDFHMLVSVLGLNENQEAQFIMYLELDALKAGIAEYLGVEHPSLDRERCRISSIEQTEEYSDIAFVILPPQELPKITACSKADKPS